MNLKLMGIALAVIIGAAHAQTSAPTSRREFEVASIKPNNNIDESFQVSGGPRWSETKRWDIVAEPLPNVPRASFE